ncbi:MAG TPA: 50S ribosomal protein L15 [Deltaproteobacteria bacterium]|uniref:Large ribosomal subunit protein uL15 n=1 Tax=uncultured delta proteobacterium Rifle_16ft_4_minimus_184 TaxID=1665175 RepID=A0A0H4T1H3_9DELT|nr:50S ribosomal protein L15, large subunit ribosomal protein L15 [uncultured delta proteobacterium Rifle_16ft_4_minimus_184]OGP20715.1 MAG: 50S ribosomal protein L15 [Deltaproteobacteria bacterium GWA2_65_63]OGP28263.1 MAG: 50S ribosomal protein L15 [Deltaproteobacteria bacterium GWB2_65_81]OGP40352.1 MAG: 50S ribosomal protein L15 [Deltaproteobacteria bacterium GWC2_66_88]OGP77958.1 MAG: 50S ribosomal protein L15 [Deltaproteobacteria bacterium RBG_16_66_15]HAM33730.1 50S ribosomal protein L1
MKLTDLRPAKGAKSSKKRVGRGKGSGLAKTAGKGHKGLRARSGGGSKPGYEGGQMPLQRRLPKRGFVNVFREETAVVNVKDLNRFEAGFVVDAEALRGEGLVKGACPGGIKLLGDGEVTRKLTVKVDRASKTAVAKVEAAGGTVEV